MAQSKITETINELIAELIGLNKAEPDFDIYAEIIVTTINELNAELINLTGIESSSSVATSAEIIMIVRYKEAIEQLLTEIISLKRFEAVARQNAQVSAVAETDTNLKVISLTINVIIASITDGAVFENERAIADGNDLDTAVAELV